MEDAQLLVPTDFSDGSARALKQARALAPDRNIHIINVIRTEWDLEGWVLDRSAASAPPFDLTLPQRVRQRRKELDAWLGTQKAAAIQSRAVVHGDPAGMIAQRVEELAIDMIVMCRRGRHWVAQNLLGSVSEKVVRLSNKPVLVVPLDADLVLFDEVDRVVAAVDLTPAGRRCVTVALDFARDAASVTVLHVASEATPDAQRRRDLLADWLDQEKLGGVRLEVPVGRPAATILEAARSEEAGLLVLASKGQSAVAGIGLGSTAGRVLRRAERPVLVLEDPTTTRSPGRYR